MHEFDRRGGTDMAVSGITTEFRRGQRQHRPKPLAATVDEVMSKLGDHLDVGHCFVENNAIDGF